MKRPILYLFISLTLTLTGHAEDTEDDIANVVAHAYPAALTQFSLKHRTVERRQQAFISFSSRDSRYLVAAYSCGTIAAVVLLEAREDSPFVVDQTIASGLVGTRPAVRAIDLDGDGQPEAVVTFSLTRGAETWIYRVNNHRLQLISPTFKDGDTMLQDPKIMNFSNAVTKDLIDSSGFRNRDSHDVDVRFDHYVLQKGQYVPVAPLDFYGTFYRQRDAAKPETMGFSIPATALGQSFKMTILNGEENGGVYRVRSAVIRLNGATVVGGEDFPEGRQSSTISVTLQETNTLTVWLCAGSAEGEAERDCDEHGRIAIAIYH